MIYEHNIERKDFSLVFPEILGKIRFIGSSLINMGITEDDLSMNGAGLILNEISKDLELINKTLYP